MQRSPRQQLQPTRRGLMMPAVALAMLLVLVAAAAVINKLWIDAAQIELVASAEASALAAARALISDEQLTTDPPSLREAARDAARRVARANRVAGRIPHVPRAGIRFGMLIPTPTGKRFHPTDEAAETVVVTAFRERSRNNPVAAMYEGASGGRKSDLWARVEATIDNRILGFRPIGDHNIPVLPMAILLADPAGEKADNWKSAINDRQGSDNFSWDVENNTPRAAADGIPEMRLVSRKPHQQSGEQDDSNCRMLDIGNGFLPRICARQIARGISFDDLEELGRSFKIEENDTQEVRGNGIVRDGVIAELKKQIGRQFVVPVYETEEGGWVRCREFVAVRILFVQKLGRHHCEVFCQPTAMCTRTAILDRRPNARRNRYIHKIQLTH